MHLEIVTHCWRYSRLLTYQLSSLVLFPPQSVQVTMTVFHATDDEPTVRVLEFFQRQQAENVVWRWWDLPRPQLLRRAIGRNQAALRTQADWVWFADADMCFGDGCLDALPSQLTELPEADAVPLVYPRTVLISRDHSAGDAHIDRARGKPRLLDIDRSRFVPKRYRRAIGGVQIVPGGILRELGYCRGQRRHLQPADRWRRCRSDVAFRRALGTRGLPVNVPHVYRLRHSRRGREGSGVRL